MTARPKPWPAMMGALRRWLADRGGSSAIEFAVLAPLVAVLATLGYAGIMLHAGAVSLEMGAAAAARWSIIGTAPMAAEGCRLPAETRVRMIRCIVEQHVCPQGGEFCYWDDGWQSKGDDEVLSPLRLEMRAFVDARNVGRSEPFTDANGNGLKEPAELYVDVNGNGQWDADTWAVAEGGSGDHVVFTLSMGQRVVHPLLVPVLGERLIREARLVVRNEPY